MESANIEKTDILICGCGPTGAMLSGYLARYGISNVVLEKEPGMTTDPRGIALDEDGIRLVQGLGLFRHLFTDVGICLEQMHFVGGQHHDLWRKPFMTEITSAVGSSGHVGMLLHKQPLLEKYLRSTIGPETSSELRSGCSVTSIQDDRDSVLVTYVDRQNYEQRVRAKFMVGADGKIGFTRKRYLEPRGIQLQWAEPTKYQETWVALNLKISLPTPETHPSFPLWGLGYTPEKVFDQFFPEDFRFLCNPQRSAICSRFGPKHERLWRFEFVVADGENGQEMAQPSRIEQVVHPYLTHSAKMYGTLVNFSVSEDVRFPIDYIEVLRCRPFNFSARSCNRWSEGRVIVIGDAAHVMPPYGGQGIASGFRDAISLGWRLALACKAEIPTVDHERLLQPWYAERKQQLEASLAVTVRNGRIVKNIDATTASTTTRPEPGPAKQTCYAYAKDMPFLPEFAGGRLFPQAYCLPLLNASPMCFSDDAIFNERKKGLFQLVILAGRDTTQLNALANAIYSLEGIQHVFVPSEATFFVRRQDIPFDASSTFPRNTYRTASAEEFDASVLSSGLPRVKGYREFNMWEGVEDTAYIILRSDRFVFSTCDEVTELRTAVGLLKVMLAGLEMQAMAEF